MTIVLVQDVHSTTVREDSTFYRDIMNSDLLHCGLVLTDTTFLVLHGPHKTYTSLYLFVCLI